MKHVDPPLDPAAFFFVLVKFFILVFFPSLFYLRWEVYNPFSEENKSLGSALQKL